MAMKTYIDQLKVEAEAANLRREEVKGKSHNAGSRVLCDTPLTDQITALMASLPPAQRNRPWSMEELVTRLSGRFSVKPHPMNVGSALRQLNWQQRRDWTCNGGGRRFWLAPSKV